MQYIQRDKLVHIEWSIFRGTSQVPEDFSRALVKMFLIGGNEKYLLTATAEGGKLLADLPGDLPEGAYSLEAIWVKNYGNLLPHRQPLTPGGEPVCPRRPGPHPNDPCFIHPHDNRFNDRCLMRSRKDYVFALTDYPSEETVTGESGEVTVRLASSVATYGYDGLSAYQIAVMRGDFSGTEGEFLAQSGFTKLKTINGESLIGEGNIEITGGGTLETATETKLGGIRAATKTQDETVEVKIDPATGKLYVPAAEAMTLEAATETKLGGIKASAKTNNETVEAKIGSDGKLYVPASQGEELKTATETTLGGIRAATKTSLETQEVKIDPSTGKLYTQPGGEGGVEIVNNPDEEDLHSIEKSTDVHVLQFADKEYNASAFSGLGRVYLRKNISSNKNILTQAMMSKANTRYIIQYDYDLDGETITVPEGCTLDFQGGSLGNGTVKGNETRINAEIYEIFKQDMQLSGSWNVDYAYSEWFESLSDDDAIAINKCITSFSNCRLLKKTYRIKSGIEISNDQILEGVNNASRISVDAAIERGAIYVYGGSVNRNNVVKGIILQNEDSCEVGVYLNGFSHKGIISDMEINNFTYAGIYITKCWYAKFENIQAWSSKNNLVIESDGLVSGDQGGQVNCVSFINCWFNHPLDESDSHNIIISNSGFDINFNNCTIENCDGDEASCKIEKQWSSVTFLNCYFENAKGCMISFEPNYSGAGCLNLIGGHFNKSTAVPIIDVGEIDKLVILGTHLGYFSNPTTSIESKARKNFVFCCQSGMSENNLINATGLVFGDFNNSYNNPAYNHQASSWSSPLLKAMAKGKQGELVIGRSDGTVVSSGLTEAHFKLNADDYANNLQLTFNNKSEDDINSLFGLGINPWSLNVFELVDYGKISGKSILVGNHDRSTVDNNLFFQIGMGLKESDSIYNEYARIFVTVRTAESSERKDVILINRDRKVYLVDKEGVWLNSDGTIGDKVIHVTNKNQITGTGKIFKIMGDIDLGGESITIPENSTLDFQGGKITNGTVVLWKTKILPMGCNIRDYITATISNDYATGQFIYDPELSKMKLWNGSNWVNMDGSDLS